MHPLTQDLQDQYNHYPFPMVPLGGEDAKLPPPSSYAFAHYYCHHQRAQASLSLRILDAGCGTGHSTLKLLQANPNAEIVAIELSSASLAIAQQRSQQAGLQSPRLTWHQGDLMELSQWQLGSFDYINCSGVLHHLPDPVAGLRLLAAHLKPNGLMFLLLYSQHARYYIHKVQQALKALLPEPIQWEQAVTTCQILLQGLPHDHPAKQDWQKHWQAIRHNLGTTSAQAAAFLVDTYLNRCEHVYNLPGIYHLLDAAELTMLRFLDESTWDPRRFMPALQDHFGDWDWRQRYLWMDHWRTDANYAFFCSPHPSQRGSVSFDWEQRPWPSPVIDALPTATGWHIHNQLGQSLQLSPPLHRVWAQLDGHNTWTELANQVAEAEHFSLAETQNGLAPHFKAWLDLYFVMV